MLILPIFEPKISTVKEAFPTDFGSSPHYMEVASELQPSRKVRKIEVLKFETGSIFVVNDVEAFPLWAITKL